jgi:hypothetical protein
MTAIVSLPSVPLPPEPPRQEAAARARIAINISRFIQVSG